MISHYNLSVTNSFDEIFLIVGDLSVHHSTISSTAGLHHQILTTNSGLTCGHKEYLLQTLPNILCRAKLPPFEVCYQRITNLPSTFLTYLV